MNQCEALNDTILPIGVGANNTAPIVVAKGSTIKYSPYYMQRREDL